MKEVIARRNQFLNIACLVSSILALDAGFNWTVPDMPWMKYPVIIVGMIGIAFMIFFLISTPSKVIERLDDKLILREPPRKKNEIVIKIADIVAVDFMPNPQKPSNKIKNSIEIKVIADGIEQIYYCTSILKPKKVLEKLKALIGKE